jgi:hemolysin III
VEQAPFDGSVSSGSGPQGPERAGRDEETRDDLANVHGETGEPEDALRAAREVYRELRREQRRQHIEALPYSLGEEIANAITHGLGWLFSVFALVALLYVSISHGDPWEIASSIVYGTSLILLYGASTLYHAIVAPRARQIFKVLDHSAIYLLIAGTYTPFAIVLLRDQGGWWLFWIVWILAAVGIAAEAFWVDRPKWLSAIVYLGMGWLAIFMIKPITATLAPEGVWLLVGGGLAYTLGTIFYVLKKVPYMHSIWHLWVLAGSVCHFIAVIRYVY